MRMSGRPRSRFKAIASINEGSRDVRNVSMSSLNALATRMACAAMRSSSSFLLETRAGVQFSVKPDKISSSRRKLAVPMIAP